jgi:integration host factor subunit alpha
MMSFETTLEIIKLAIRSGDDVLISGFGKFCLKQKPERSVRNPATGEEMMLGMNRVAALNIWGN